MVSDTDTARPEPASPAAAPAAAQRAKGAVGRFGIIAGIRAGSRAGGGARGGGSSARRRFSPLTRRILAVNVIALAILVGGVLYLDQYRASLIASRLEALMTQGQIIGEALGESATTGEFEADLDIDLARQILRRLVAPSGIRARLFGEDGLLLVDTRRLNTGGQVLTFELPPPEGESAVRAALEFLYDAIVPLLPRLDPAPAYSERQFDVIANFPEAVRALSGQPTQMERVAADGTPVLSVAVPVQRLRKVMGVLVFTVEARDVVEIVRSERLAIVEVFSVALAATTLLSLYLAGTIARPIRRLAAAAERVRRGRGRVALPDFSRREDEIGDLAGSFAAMTEALYGRIDAIEHFAADVAHELKNPLSSIRSALETLARSDDPGIRARLMAIAQDDVRRLDRLISDISDASRLDAELARAEAAPVDMARLLASLAEVYSATLPEGDRRRVEMEAEAGADLVVPGFERRLGQVFRNLIDNALSFSPPDGRIRLVARRQGGRVIVAVEDEGPGLPEAATERVFDRFYSERPAGEAFGTHSGLGLSIARQIVEAHGGRIAAANRPAPGGGTAGARFTVELPA